MKAPAELPVYLENTAIWKLFSIMYFAHDSTQIKATFPNIIIHRFWKSAKKHTLTKQTRCRPTGGFGQSVSSIKY